MIDIIPFAAFLAPIIVFIAVGRQSKTFAALAQLGSVQQRLSTSGDATQEKLKTHHPNVLLKDKLLYTLGVVNMGITMYWIGASPTTFYIWHTPKAIVLIYMRWRDFQKTKQHYMLFDFCYWANLLTLIYIWFLPHSPELFEILWVLSNGPLAWATLTFNHSMIFHSYPHITSVFIHTSPMFFVLGLRWNPTDEFTICTGDCAPSVFRLLWMGVSRFYVWWIVMYYFWIFLVLGRRIQSRGYQTLFDRVIKGPGRWIARVHPHHLVQKAAYMMVHFTFGCFNMALAALMWHSRAAHMLFAFFIGVTVAFNGAGWYFSVFLEHYSKIQQEAKTN